MNNHFFIYFITGLYIDDTRFRISRCLFLVFFTLFSSFHVLD